LPFFFALAGMLAGSANFNNNMAFFMTFLLAAFSATALIHTMIVRRHLAAQVEKSLWLRGRFDADKVIL
jgi:hypothetical protein